MYRRGSRMWWTELMNGFYLDRISFVLLALILFIGLCVGRFAWHSLAGDRFFGAFFIRLSLLLASLSLMVMADHFVLFWLFWTLSSAILARMIVHQPEWEAARQSGQLASQYFLTGSACVAAAMYLLFQDQEVSKFSQLMTISNFSLSHNLACCLLLVAAMIQSGIWPFHKWLLSSLNAPTPVSALMHAGLVNGGGLLLARFAPALISSEILMNLIFAIGIAIALLGTIWKLVQPDVKRMLACSTMSQMGFMLAQCGLGLFSAAIAHMVFHGLFKAYLFLGSSAAAQQDRIDRGVCLKPFSLCMALLSALVATLCFAWVSQSLWLHNPSGIVVLVVCFLASFQVALTLFSDYVWLKWIRGSLLTVFLAACYGVFLNCVEEALLAGSCYHPQSLSVVHVTGMIAFSLAYMGMLVFTSAQRRAYPQVWMLRAYVQALNASQPDSQTVTSHRNLYRY